MEFTSKPYCDTLEYLFSSVGILSLNFPSRRTNKTFNHIKTTIKRATTWLNASSYYCHDRMDNNYWIIQDAASGYRHAPSQSWSMTHHAFSSCIRTQMVSCLPCLYHKKVLINKYTLVTPVKSFIKNNIIIYMHIY